MRFSDLCVFHKSWEFAGAEIFFWQISDCLSQKNILDPAEHLLLGQKHRYSKIIQYTANTRHNVRDIHRIVRFSDFHVSSQELWVCRRWNFFWQISVVCHRKISWISQSTFCCIKNTDTLKSCKIPPIQDIMREIYIERWDFRIFMFLLKSCEFAGGEIFFDKSQIVCQGKISWISQSTFCWVKNTDSRKTCIIPLMWVIMREIWT